MSGPRGFNMMQVYYDWISNTARIELGGAQSFDFLKHSLMLPIWFASYLMDAAPQRTTARYTRCPAPDGASTAPRLWSPIA
jgi:hypothetical protein